MNDEIDELEREIEKNIKKQKEIDSDKHKVNRKKLLRIEYKIFLFFLIIFLAYSFYQLFTIKVMPKIKGEASVGTPLEKENKPSSIAEAVSAERPIVLSAETLQTTIDKMKAQSPDIVDVEKASESDTPTIWIYVFNDGARKDKLAAQYCDWFKENKIAVMAVTVLDNDAKKKGKLIELGEKRCM